MFVWMFVVDTLSVLIEDCVEERRIGNGLALPDAGFEQTQTKQVIAHIKGNGKDPVEHKPVETDRNHHRVTPLQSILQPDVFLHQYQVLGLAEANR